MGIYYAAYQTSYAPYLAHHGVKGMKWGVRHDPNAMTIYGAQSQYTKKYESKSDRYAVQDTYKHNAQTAYKVGKKAVAGVVSVAGTIYTVSVLTGHDQDLIRAINRGIDAVGKHTRGY